MARISLQPPDTPLLRAAKAYSKRMYGDVLQPGLAFAHNTRVLLTYVRFERSLARWNRLDDDLKGLAVMASAATIGCAWCMDFGHWTEHARGMDSGKLRAIPFWRDSDAFSGLERLVLGYAEAMSTTPPQVSDDMVAALSEHLDQAQLVELTMMIAVENQRSRFNSALGLTSQGFSDRCELPIR
ncbi:MAG: FIG01126393: hypothetical protein [uncultured Chloroflexia bacterium]|uniref:Carboxymuconolactone decarboxylase-like domain-containing protein n=1 Tax=uncultured Chloroflexia bacterium TaxID=1672391 RepID=A0A6J4JHE1_9CHLR|nr:MAG: FIG01126393: hypothetical protein [uncultured Chloroflexia bacterium]